MHEQIRRVLVWSGRLRFAHWMLALSVFGLLATGWLLGNAPSVGAVALDLHYLAASVLVFALVLRIYLGFAGQGAERLVHLVPTRTELQAMRASLLFFLSLGKAPLPRWYAHNPMWKPVYLVWFLVLVLAAFSGWLMNDGPLFAGIYLPQLHAWLAVMSAVLTVAHVFSVVLQDLKGRQADVSSMINGYRYFLLRQDDLVRPDVQEVSVRLDQLGRK